MGVLFLRDALGHPVSLQGILGEGPDTGPVSNQHDDHLRSSNPD